MVASKKKLKWTPKETSQNQIVHVIIASLNFALTQDRIQLDTCEELDKDANFIYLHIAKIGRYAVSLIPISRNIFFLILKKKIVKLICFEDHHSSWSNIYWKGWI